MRIYSISKAITDTFPLFLHEVLEMFAVAACALKQYK